MKSYTLILLLILTLASCRKNNAGTATFTYGDTVNINGFRIISDTVTFDTKGLLLPYLKYKDNYYCEHYNKDKPSIDDRAGIYIINKNGDIDSTNNAPYSKLGRDDFHASHDSVFCSSYYNDTDYYLDEKNKEWLSIKKTDDVIFEDNNYYVTTLNYGEWGSATWFKDKKTLLEYEAPIGAFSVRKAKNAYYLVTSRGIYKVMQPKLLVNVGKVAYRNYKNKKNVGKFYERKSKGNYDALETIYKSNTPLSDDYKFYSEPSFVVNNNLYIIVTDSIKTYIATMANKKRVPVATIGDSIVLYENDYTYRNRHISQSIPFSTGKGTDLYGILEIEGNTIYLHYFKRGK